MDTQYLTGFDVDRRLVEYGIEWQKYVEDRKAEIDPTGKKVVIGDYRIDGPNAINFAIFIKSEDNTREFFWDSSYFTYMADKSVQPDEREKQMLAEVRQQFYKAAFNDFMGEYRCSK